jgi:four helix bundle protein
MVIIHKNLEVYRLILEFIKLAADIIKHIPRGQSHLSDQLRRASTSMAFNTGEGAGEFAKKEKARFYRMALRSATESASIIDVIHGFGYIGVDLYDRSERLLDRIIGMLTKLIKRHGGLIASGEALSPTCASPVADFPDESP